MNSSIDIPSSGLLLILQVDQVDSHDHISASTIYSYPSSPGSFNHRFVTDMIPTDKRDIFTA
jgi:hypothetical protein